MKTIDVSEVAGLDNLIIWIGYENEANIEVEGYSRTHAQNSSCLLLIMMLVDPVKRSERHLRTHVPYSI